MPLIHRSMAKYGCYSIEPRPEYIEPSRASTRPPEISKQDPRYSIALVVVVDVYSHLYIGIKARAWACTMDCTARLNPRRMI